MAIEFENQMVQYPMFAWCVPHVTKFLNQLCNDKDSPATEGSEALTQSRVAPSPWSIEDLRRLKPLIQHNKVAKAMLDLAAETPGKYVTFPDACRKAGLDVSQGRSGMGALTKVCNKIGKRDMWPVKYHWAANGEQVACYIMTKDVADKWQEVSAE